MAFLEVPRTEAAAVKKIAAGRVLHSRREAAAGYRTHHGRDASRAAFWGGHIKEHELKNDFGVYKAANTAKHRSGGWPNRSPAGRGWWADTLSSSGEDGDDRDGPSSGGGSRLGRGSFEYY